MHVRIYWATSSAARREDITTASRLRGLTSSDITLHTDENSSVGRALLYLCIDNRTTDLLGMTRQRRHYYNRLLVAYHTLILLTVGSFEMVDVPTSAPGCSIFLLHHPRAIEELVEAYVFPI